MDYLESLPTDDYPVKPDDAKLIKNILIADESPLYRIILEFKDPIISGLLFIIFNMQGFDDFLKSTVPYARSSDTSLILFKAIIFIILLFLIKNVNLSLRT